MILLWFTVHDEMEMVKTLSMTLQKQRLLHNGIITLHAPQVLTVIVYIKLVDH